MDILERLRASPQPLAKHLGIELIEASPERMVARLTVTEAVCTVGGILHGGAVMALADSAAATGAFLNLPRGAGTTTIESKTNFLKAAPVGTTVTATAMPVHVGRRSSVWQTRVTDPAGKLVALVTQTQLVI